MTGFPKTVRHWVVVCFAAVGVALLPWTVLLSATLKAHHETKHWDLAWSGFDTGLALLFILTAVAAHRRSPWIAPLAAATGTVLLVDAWFDIILESHADELRNAILLAVFAELPGAIVCFWIAFRAERVISHLVAAAESASERNLVRVLQVTADGEPAGEPSHADPSA